MDQFETGKSVGRKHYAHIVGKGSRWQTRNVPAYIRQHLMVPYYFTHDEATNEHILWVIQSPLGNEKVHFVRFAKLDEKQKTGPVPNHPE